jgi:wobble nucleotide-excising tRNase
MALLPMRALIDGHQETINSSSFTLDIFQLKQELEELSNDKQRAINNLSKSEAEKITRRTELIREIQRLEDKSNITLWHSKIETYFLNHQLINNYLKVIKSISTKGISDLSKIAHNELLTDSIRIAFENELKALGKDIAITLENPTVGKGTVHSQLKLLGKDIRDILSEGEQKAIALALFIAEIKCQGDNTPIVFDDPVTSLDHQAANALAKNLLVLALEQQVIIFTHNKLFYNSLITNAQTLKNNNSKRTQHVCKDYTKHGCNGEGYHIRIYKIDKETRDRTGRITPALLESLNYWLQKAEQSMKENDYLCVPSYLKKAIEYYIDEKVMNKQGLMEDSKVKDHIEWERLKGLNPDKDTIDQLKTHWDALSNRGSHLSENSSENPLSVEELNKIINFLQT